MISGEHRVSVLSTLFQLHPEVVKWYGRLLEDSGVIEDFDGEILRLRAAPCAHAVRAPCPRVGAAALALGVEEDPAAQALVPARLSYHDVLRMLRAKRRRSFLASARSRAPQWLSSAPYAV